MQPDEVFARWWAMTEACSGTKGRLDDVRWYRVPGDYVSLDGELVGGYWSKAGNAIVLPVGQIEDGAGVRHEMLHALLRTGGHPRSAFLEKCASLVPCAGACVRDAGPWRPPLGYLTVPPDSLQVSIAVDLEPTAGAGDRWVSLRALVRNPLPNVLLIAAPGDARMPPTFGYDVRGPTGGIAGGLVATDSSMLVFGPYESKSWLFEFRLANELTARRLPPGELVFVGSFARHRSGEMRVRL